MDKKNDICADCAFNVGTCAEGFMPKGDTCQGYQKATRYPAYIGEYAIAAYDAYCAEVGGVDFRGEPLPCGKAFFADPSKEKQANGWRAAAMKVAGVIVDKWAEHMRERNKEAGLAE